MAGWLSFDSVGDLHERAAMILSLHLRKCAGTSFREALLQEFEGRLLQDYGDEIGSSWPTSHEKRLKSLAKVQRDAETIVASFDIIHGHYFRSKYSALDCPQELITFLRDPVERVVSNYHYLRRSLSRTNPDIITVRDLGFSLMEYAAHEDCRNFQTRALENLAVEEFAFIGFVETYDASIAGLNRRFGWSLSAGGKLNAAPSDHASDLSAKVRDELRNLNAADVAFYEAARARFESVHG